MKQTTLLVVALLLGVASSIQISEFKNDTDAKKWVELPNCAGAQGEDASVPLKADLSNVTIATCKGTPGPATPKTPEQPKVGQQPVWDPIQVAKDHKFKDSDHHVTLNPGVDPTDGMEGPLTPKHAAVPEPDVKGPIAAPGQPTP